MQAADDPQVIELLKEIVELELSGVIRFTPDGSVPDETSTPVD